MDLVVNHTSDEASLYIFLDDYRFPFLYQLLVVIFVD